MKASGTTVYLLRGYPRGQVIGLLGLMFASAVTEGFGLLLLVPMLAVLTGDGAKPTTSPDWLSSIGGSLTLAQLLVIFVGLVVLRSVINHFRQLGGQRFEMAVVDRLRARAWNALLHCEWRVVSKRRQSGAASLLITDIDRIGFGANQVLRALATAVTLAGIGLAAFALAPLLALAAVAGGVLVLLAYRRMRARATHLGEQLGKAYADVHQQFNEGLGALRVIKSFGREDAAAARGTEAISGMRKVQIAFVRDTGLSQIALQSGGALLLAILVWLAIERWHVDAVAIVPLVALFARALPLLGALQQAWQNWANAAPAIASAMALIEEAEAAREPEPDDACALPVLSDSIELRALGVHYAGRTKPALADIDMTIRARTVVALTGHSGAGKSTLADVLSGLIAPDTGSMAIDGQVLDGKARRAWRGKVAYVQQEPVLFSGTVRENLAWAEPGASDAQMVRALGDASAQFVLALPDGLDTRVGDGGRALSGGERQRVVLARALLREPALLILDEAASALDAENELAIARAIERLRSDLTIVIIGHRGPLAELADTIVTFENGRISGSAG